MHESDVPILLVAGIALQYVRGHAWGNDLVTLLAAFAFGLLAAWLNHDAHTVKALLSEGILHVPNVLGGTLLGHMAAHA